MLEKIDASLLEKIEKFTHWWQKTFGQDCFWWAKVFIVLFIVFMNSFAVLGILFGNKFDPILFGSFMLTLLSPLVFLTIKIAQARAYQNQVSGLANECKLFLQDKRLMMLVIFNGVGFAWGLFEYLQNIPIYIVALCPLGFSCLGIAYYALSCDPLPPAKSKVKIWLENFMEKTKEFLTPQPALVPVPVRNR